MMTDPPETEPNGIVNVTEALKFTAGDADLLRSVIELFLDEGPNQVQAVRSCVDANDGPGIASSAHQLKGSIVIFGAEAAVAAAVALESAAKTDLADVPSAWESLQAEMTRLLDALQNFLNR